MREDKVYPVEELHYRMSSVLDYTALKELMMERFGNRSDFQVLENLNDRYLLCVTPTGEVVAMTGIYDGNNYNAPEIDWTCVSKKYECLGLMTKMVGMLLEKHTGPVYCSCWRWFEKEHVNLKKIMDTYGFKEVMRDHKKYRSDINYFCSECVHKCEGCHCSEDLYYREGTL